MVLPCTCTSDTLTSINRHVICELQQTAAKIWPLDLVDVNNPGSPMLTIRKGRTGEHGKRNLIGDARWVGPFDRIITAIECKELSRVIARCREDGSIL